MITRTPIAGLFTRLALLCFALFFLRVHRAAADFTTFGGPSLRWDAVPVEFRNQSTYLSYTIQNSPTPPDGILPPQVFFLARNTDYLLRVRLYYTENNSQCPLCAAEYSSVGGYPDIRLTTDASVETATPLDEWKSAVPLGVTEWYVPFSTASAGFIYARITTNGFITTTIDYAQLQDLTLPLPVGWEVELNGNGEYTSLLGSFQDASFIPSPPTDARIFRSVFLPGVSAGWFGFYDVIHTLTSAGDSIVPYTQSSWAADTRAIRFDHPGLHFSSINQCEGLLNGKTIVNAAVVQNGVVLHTLGGVFVGTPDLEGSEGITYDLVLPYCISTVSVSSQSPAFNLTGCTGTFAIGGRSDAGNIANQGQIWMMRAGTTTFKELLDKFSRRLYAALSDSYDASSVTIISAALSPVSCVNVQLLIKLSGSEKYALAAFDTAKLEWKQTFVFPENIPNICPDSTSKPALVYSAMDLPTQGAPTRKLVLNGMQFHRTMSRDLFFWGSALLFSPNDGLTVHLLRTFNGNTNVTTFTSTMDGAYAFLTTDDQVFYGQVGIARIIPITNPRKTTGDGVYGIEFDELEELYLIKAMDENGHTVVKRERLDVQSMLDYAEMVDGVKCPYIELRIDADNDPYYTRSSNYVDNDVPSAIFLDRGDNYTFSVTVTPADSSMDLSELNVHFQLSNSNLVNISAVRTEQDGKVLYQVTVVDLESINVQHMPGINGSPTELKIIVDKSTFDCINFRRSTTVKSEISNVVVFYSGCAPRQRVSLNPAPETFAWCAQPDPDVPCVFYENDFATNFLLEDLVSGTSKSYKNEYVVRVVGGGHSKTDIKYFTDSEILAYNPSTLGFAKAPIWGVLHTKLDYSKDTGAPILNAEANSISWVCAMNSPCYHVNPEANPHPEYYLMMEMSTLNVSLQHSYCHHTTRFLIRLYGIPLEFFYSLAVLLSSFVASVVLTIAIGYYERWKFLRNSEGMESSFMMAKETGLPHTMDREGILRTVPVADDAKSYQSFSSDESPSLLQQE